MILQSIKFNNVILPLGSASLPKCWWMVVVALPPAGLPSLLRLISVAAEFISLLIKGEVAAADAGMMVTEEELGLLTTAATDKLLTPAAVGDAMMG